MADKTSAQIINDLKREKRMDTHILSKRTGIKYNTLRGYLNENPLKNNITLDSIIKIADALNVSVDYLLGRTEIKNYNDQEALENFMKKVIDDYFKTSAEK